MPPECYVPMTSARTAEPVVAGVAPSPVAVTGALAFAVTSVALVQTSSIALLPELPAVFGSSIASVSWVATSTLVAGAVANPIVGRMGDLYGKRTLVQWCLASAVVGSVIGATAHSLLVVVLARGLQGIGSGVIPLSFGILHDEVPSPRLNRSVSVLTASGAGLGAGLGPVLMGAVLAAHGWRAVFWVTFGVLVTSMVLVFAWTRAGTRGARVRFDWPGAFLLSTALVTLLLAVTKGAEWHWVSGRVLLLFALAASVLGIWVRWELRHPAPLVDLVRLGTGNVLLAHVGGFMVGFTVFGQYIITFTLVSLPAATGYGLGRSAAVAGLVQLPGAIALSVASLIGSRVSDVHGAPRLLPASSLVIVVGLGLGAMWHGSVLEVAIAIVVVDLGLGAAFCSLPILIMDHVEAEHMAAANALNALSRVVGSAVASAVVPAVLASGTAAVGGAALPAEWTFVTAYALVAAVAAAVTVTGIVSGRRLRKGRRPGFRRGA